MKKYYVDLHVHTCLSPCGNDDMIPYNIFAMAKIKGLDAVAITDHNSTLNLPSAKAAADFFHIELIPGIEITSREEIHVLAYFPTVEIAMVAGEWIGSHLPDQKNRGDIFGKQVIIGLDHQPIGEEEGLLIGATDLSFEEIAEKVISLGGIYVPAHINRGAYSLLKQFGFLPKTIPMPILEVVTSLPVPWEVLQGRMILSSSDAHSLDQILEPTFFLEKEPENGSPATAYEILEHFFLGWKEIEKNNK